MVFCSWKLVLSNGVIEPSESVVVSVEAIRFQTFEATLLRVKHARHLFIAGKD